MRAHLQPLLSAFPGARWLTLGDGAFGLDAHYVIQRSADAVASSLVTDTHQQAAARGFIKHYLQVNAEQIDLPDNSFDFVLCKEAYHHFLRPPIALYEALRVARHAVVLIKPQEQPRRPLDVLRSMVKRVLRGDATTQFEPAGNYIYRLSVRDTERLMTAIGHRCIACKPFKDFYWARLARGDCKADSLALAATQLGVGVQNLLGWLGLMSWGQCCLVVVKGELDPALASALEHAGFRLRRLPSNPYAADALPASAH